MAVIKPITNDIIYDFKIKENDPPCNGFALAKKNGYAYFENDGLKIKKDENGLPLIAGRTYYDEIRSFLENKIKPFLIHLDNIFHNDKRDAQIFLDYMAFKMQYPSVKIRWALVIGGDQGIGKDVAIDACFHDYGLNFIHNVSPNDILSNYNDFVECLLLRISEVADLQEANRWTFNERLKVLIAGHPDNMLINRKYGFKYWSRLYNGTVLTTNHLENGLFISEGDRRYYVIKCTEAKKLGFDNQDKKELYFTQLFKWLTTKDPIFDMNGYEWIAQYLYYYRDISDFNPNICPKSTKAKNEIVSNSNSVSDALDLALITISEQLQKGHYGSIFKQNSVGYPVIINLSTLKNIIKEKDCFYTFNRLPYELQRVGYERIESNGKTGIFDFRINGNRYRERFYILKDFSNYQKQYKAFLFKNSKNKDKDPFFLDLLNIKNDTIINNNF